MSEMRSIFPDYSPQEGERINKAIRRRDDADYRCYEALREARRWVGVQPECEDVRDVADIRGDVDEALEEREAANEEFLRAVARRPPSR